MCQCGPEVKVQEYQNQVVLRNPFGVRRKTVCIDRCLSTEVQYLWSLGIETTGCCCGHNTHRAHAYIGVTNEHIDQMKGMGYKVVFNSSRPGDDDEFSPKSDLA